METSRRLATLKFATIHFLVRHDPEPATGSAGRRSAQPQPGVSRSACRTVIGHAAHRAARRQAACRRSCSDCEIVLAGVIGLAGDRGVFGEVTVDFTAPFVVDIGLIGIAGIEVDGSLRGFAPRQPTDVQSADGIRPASACALRWVGCPVGRSMSSGSFHG